MIEKIKELERIIEILDQEGVEKCEKLEAQAKQIKKLEKALDKASKTLEDLEYAYCLFDFDYRESNLYHKGRMYSDKEQWKEKFLKEVQEDEELCSKK